MRPAGDCSSAAGLTVSIARRYTSLRTFVITYHIGYHKTATSFLQASVFPRHPDLAYCDPATNARDRGFIEIARAHDFDYDPEPLRAIVRANGERPVLVSYEGFVGDAFAGAQASLRTAERLAALMPDAKIAVVLRNQRDMIESLYRQYVAEGGIAGPAAFVAGETGPRTYFAPSYLRYERLLSRYLELFGRTRVWVGLYEAFRAEPTGFVHDLLSFAGVDPERLERVEHSPRNRALSSASIRVARVVNRVLSSPIAPIGPLGRTKITATHVRALLQDRIDPLLRTRIADRACVSRASLEPFEPLFRNTNRWLADRLELPVERYGYPL
jgi:hypothetical protein